MSEEKIVGYFVSVPHDESMGYGEWTMRLCGQSSLGAGHATLYSEEQAKKIVEACAKNFKEGPSAELLPITQGEWRKILLEREEERTRILTSGRCPRCRKVVPIKERKFLCHSCNSLGQSAPPLRAAEEPDSTYGLDPMDGLERAARWDLWREEEEKK